MMNYESLRDWLTKVDQLGELRKLDGVDWNLEMGAIVDVLYREHPPYPPALLFDEIKDHTKGYRALFGHFASPKRIALTLGVEEEFDHVLEFTRMYHEKIKHCTPVPMTEVKSGPVLENVQEGDRVNLWEFPSPLLHEKDGGRYLGTGHLVITKDPDSSWINVGTYRIMSQDRNTAGFISVRENTLTSTSRSILRKAGQCRSTSCWAAIRWFGLPPLAPCPPGSVSSISRAASEKAPVKVMRSDITGLPYPADAE
jgi:UbiD family decarboxylase